MKFSYNWLQSFFSKKLPLPEKLAELLMMHSFEVEEVKKVGNDFVIDIDVLPNRMPDCASHIGIAREISAILGYKIKEKKYSFKENKNKKTEDFIKIEVKEKKLCPRYCARVIDNVKVRPSPRWIKEKLEACGIQSINNIVDATNYIMLETGQPLHAFDAKKIDGKIIIRRAKNGEKIITLDNKEYKLDSEILVIADKNQPIAIAGIKGGKKAEIQKDTKTIIIESANFEAKSIYKTSKKLNLQTDASIRFSAGIDKNLAREAIDKVASLIRDLAGGEIMEDVIDNYYKKDKEKTIFLDILKVNSVLGFNIQKEIILKILKSLRLKIKSEKNNVLEIEVPSFRKDILIPEDLIEEIGRIYGYENFPSKFSILQENFIKENKEIDFIFKIKELMKSFGFSEICAYSFISKEEGEILEKEGKFKLIELLNPISKNIKYLRPSLIPGLLKTIKFNEKKIYHEFGIKDPEKYLRFFEVGNVFEKGYGERRFFSAVVQGKEKFYETKGLLEAILDYFNMLDLKFDLVKNNENLIWEEGESAKIIFNKKEIGYIGKISSNLVNFYQIEKPVFGFEIIFKEFLEIFKKSKLKYSPIPSYPPLFRDISVMVPFNILAGKVKAEIERVGQKNFLEKVEIFDIYSLPNKRKNISFRLTFRAKNKTLSSKELDKIQEKIIEKIEKQPNWQVKR